MSVPHHLPRREPPLQGAVVSIPGRNCWRRVVAPRTAFLVDSAAYFAALRDALLGARHNVFIIGWDFDSRVDLCPGEHSAWTTRIGELLSDLVRDRRGLHVYVLGWSYPRIFARDREPQPVVFGHRTPRRLHYHLDGTFSGLASCHQKMVVIDDAIAFVGGMDITSRRWDRPEHRAHDPLRIDPDGRPYPPVHDVMLALDGEAARSIGELARDRWRCASGRVPRAPRYASDPWPSSLVPDVRDVAAAISRTMPPVGTEPPVREVERMFLDTIASARQRIYIENQFFTSSTIGDAIARRLAEPAGPEVVVVISRAAMSWLEETTMGILRSRLMRELAGRDPHGRFAIYDPVAAGPERMGIKVHSKVLIADDTLVRIGSANLNNRSLGLDPECDVTIEAAGDPRVERAIAGLRDRLLAEHLGTDAETVSRAVDASNSLIRTIEALRGEGRSLEPLVATPPEWLEELLPGEGLVDPDTPLDSETVLEELLPEDASHHSHRPLVLAALSISFAIALVLLWTETPFGTWVTPHKLAEVAQPFAYSPLGALLVVGGYIVIGLLFVPVNVLMLATSIAFGPWLGLAYSILGYMSSAVASYAVGSLLGPHVVGRIAGRRLHRVAQRLDRHGPLAIAALRAMPIAPYVLVNLIAGASRVRFRSYLLGTFIGMLPGSVIVTLFGGHLGNLFHHPTPGNIALIVSLLVLMVGSGWILRRALARPRPR